MVMPPLELDAIGTPLNLLRDTRTATARGNPHMGGNEPGSQEVNVTTERRPL